MTIKRQKHKPSVNRQNPASAGSRTTTAVTAPTFIEAGAAGSFFGYFLLAAKKERQCHLESL